MSWWCQWQRNVFIEIMATFKAIKIHLKKSYEKQNVTLMAISYNSPKACFINFIWNDGCHDLPKQTKTERNGPKRTYENTKKGLLCVAKRTGTDFGGYRNSLQLIPKRPSLGVGMAEWLSFWTTGHIPLRTGWITKKTQKQSVGMYVVWMSPSDPGGFTGIYPRYDLTWFSSTFDSPCHCCIWGKGALGRMVQQW